jgi:hypothetical protein
MSDFFDDTAAMSALAQYVESQIVFVQGFDICRAVDSKIVSARSALVYHSSANVFVQITMSERDDSVDIIAALTYYTQERSGKYQHTDVMYCTSAARERTAVLAAVHDAIADVRDNCAVSNAVALQY